MGGEEKIKKGEEKKGKTGEWGKRGKWIVRDEIKTKQNKTNDNNYFS